MGHPFLKIERKILKYNIYCAHIGRFDLIRKIPNHPYLTNYDYLTYAAFEYGDQQPDNAIDASAKALKIIDMRKKYVNEIEYESLIKNTEEELEKYVRIMANSINEKFK